MRYQIIIAAAVILSFSACSDTNTENTTPDQEIPVYPETNPTPGQQLDTAIQNTKDAARDAKGDLKDFGENVKDKTQKAGQDIKESANNTKEGIKTEAEKAKAKTNADMQVVKEKAEEAKQEMKNN